ncbi:MAG: DUF302 domain-containing protein [candidate division KSB1 bacterium]
MGCYFSKATKYSFEEALTRVTNELQQEGFGGLTEIDVQETLQKKLQVEFRRFGKIALHNAMCIRRDKNFKESLC